MNRWMLISALLAALSVSACEKPAVVNEPVTAAPMGEPAGPTGAVGNSASDARGSSPTDQGGINNTPTNTLPPMAPPPATSAPTY